MEESSLCRCECVKNVELVYVFADWSFYVTFCFTELACMTGLVPQFYMIHHGIPSCPDSGIEER